MRHEDGDAAIVAGEPGNTVGRAVGVGRIGLGRLVGLVDVAQDHLTGRLQGRQGRVIGRDELPLAVGHRQVDRLGVGEEGAEAGGRGQADPAGLELARVVVRQGRRAGGRASGEEARLDQDLEPVADAEARVRWDALERDAAALRAELELAPEPPELEDLGLEL